MLVYLIRRIGQSLLVVAAMAVIVFVAVYAVGNPVDILANPNADEQERAAIARSLGLDRPLYEQFGVFVLNALRGDLGRSFVYNVPAVEVILQRLPATLELALVGAGHSRSSSACRSACSPGSSPRALPARRSCRARSSDSRCRISGSA